MDRNRRRRSTQPSSTHRACVRTPSPFAPPFLAPFANPDLELHFQRQQMVNDTRVDQATGLLCFLLLCHTFVKYLGAIPLAQLLPSLAAALLFLVPFLWGSFFQAPESYARHRLWVAAALRVLPDVLVIAVEDVHRWQVGRPESLVGCLSQLALFAKLPNGIIMGLGFRLPFFLHLVVHAIPLVHYIHSLPAVCALPVFQQPSMLWLLSIAHQAVARWGSVLSTGPEGWGHQLGSDSSSSGSDSSSSGGGGSGGSCTEQLGTPGSCRAVLGTLTVLLYFLVPTMLLISRE